jgi:hypothetical protein
MIKLRLLQEDWFRGIILRIDEDHEDLHTQIAIDENLLELDLETFLQFLQHELQNNTHQIFQLRKARIKELAGKEEE